MKQYILTEQEKEIIKKYIETGKKSGGFRTLLSRCRHMETINQDQQLIEQFLKKAGGGGEKNL